MKVNIRSDSPIQKTRTTDVPTLRSKFSALLVPGVAARNFAGPGYLIGMLGLTYRRVQTVLAIPAMFKSDEVPRVNIKTTD